MNETFFAPNFMETGGTVGSESRERVGYSILSVDLAPYSSPSHSVSFDFRPLSGSESGEAALCRILRSRLFSDF